MSTVRPASASRTTGVGVDVVCISAFADQLATPGTRFANVFTAHERRRCAQSARTTRSQAQHLAARWAAKEAFVKAWSESYFGLPDVIEADHLDWREIEIRSDAWGRPRIQLHGAVARALNGSTACVSLSHDLDADTATAFVVLQEEE